MKLVLSKAHWYVAWFSFALNVKVADVARIGPAGPDVIVVSGATTEKLAVAGDWSGLPAGSVARTWT